MDRVYNGAMRGIALVAGLCSLLLVGCARKEETPPAAPQPIVEKVSLAAGSEVPLVLLQDLHSGGTQEGETVALMVTENVTESSGKAVVVKGAPAKGTVTWSRSEGLLGGLSNRPARLKIRLDRVQAVDGTWIPFSTEEYEFNRANTGLPPAEPSSDKALSDFKQAYEAQGEKLSASQAEAVAKALQAVGKSSTIDASQIERANELILRARHGEGVESLLHSGALPMADTALAVVRTLGQAQSRLSGALKGRNIHAYPGSKIEAKVGEDATIKWIRR